MSMNGLGGANGFRDVREMLEYSAARYGTCVALHEKKQGFYQHISYGRLFCEIEALGTALSPILKRGARVLLVGKSSYALALSYLSLLCSAAVPVVAPDALPEGELAAIAARLKIDAVLYDSTAAQVAALGLPALSFDELPRLVEAGKAALAAGEISAFENPIDPATVATVFPTASRGENIALSNEDIIETIAALAEVGAVSSRDIFLSVLPLSHAHEVLLGLLYPLFSGASVAFGEGISSIMRNMREIHPTCMVTVPYLAARLYDKFWALAAGSEKEIRRVIAATDPVRPLSARQALKTRLLGAARAPFGGALRLVFAVGAPLTAALAKGLRQIGVFAACTYGIAECGVLGAITSLQQYCDGTAGKVLEDKIEICNPQADGSGEILIKTTAGGHLTGDRGRIDEGGFLHIVGKREHQIVLPDGTVLSPEEIERLLAQSPLVKEAAVVGVPTSAGAELAAMLVPDPASVVAALGEDYTDAALESAIGEWICDANAGLQDAAKIALFALSEQPLPRDAAGEILRADVAAMLACASTAGAASEETLSQEE